MVCPSGVMAGPPGIGAPPNELPVVMSVGSDGKSVLDATSTTSVREERRAAGGGGANPRVGGGGADATVWFAVLVMVRVIALSPAASGTAWANTPAASICSGGRGVPLTATV